VRHSAHTAVEILSPWKNDHTGCRIDHRGNLEAEGAGTGCRIDPRDNLGAGGAGCPRLPGRCCRIDHACSPRADAEGAVIEDHRTGCRYPSEMGQYRHHVPNHIGPFGTRRHRKVLS
jgi:hypothetical protein